MINLDRAPERLARISAQLQRLQLPYTRLAAVDARALTPAQKALLDEPAFQRKHGMTPVPGELGCYLSHVAVMRAFLASQAEFALVLEDDVLLQASLPAYAYRVGNELRRLFYGLRETRRETGKARGP